MKKVIDYVIQCCDCLTELENDVKSALADGWELYESPYVAVDENDIEWHYQAMVKYEQ